MIDETAKRIAANPAYHALKSKRTAFGWMLTFAMMFAYYGYILLIAFDKQLLAQKIGPGVTSLGIPLGIGVILFTIVLTWVYVRRANSEFDDMKDGVIQEASRK